MLFNEYPYRNLTDLNLDYLLKQIRQLTQQINEFVNLNSIKYADPIQWNITRQYEKNTVVIDASTGIAYISVRPVPSGVQISNTNYWTVVFDLSMFLTGSNKNITVRVESPGVLLATFPITKGELVVWDEKLYVALSAIDVNDPYVINYNIKRATIEDLLGNLADLNTTDKSNLVNAINEVLSTIGTVAGDLSDLNTTDKSNLVNAINEVLSTIGTVAGDLTDLDTTDRSNLVSAINEVLSTIGTVAGNLTDLDTTDNTNLVNAINEVLATIGTVAGNLNDLTTTDKDNLVGAINEVLLTLENVVGDLNDLTTADKTSVINAINENVVRINNSQNSIASLQTSISALTGKYNTNNLSMFANKKVCIVGDSISSGDTYPPTWVDVVTGILNTVNCTVVNVAVDGASVLGFGNDPSSIPTDCDYYIVFLGINDFQGQFSGSSMLAAVTAIANKCVRVGSVAWYISPIRMLGASTNPSTQNHTTPASAYRWIFETLFCNAGFKIISGLGAPSLNDATKSTYMGDGLHPLPAYRYLLGEYILDNIISNTETFSESSTVKTATPTPILGSGSIEITWLQNQCSIKFAISSATFAASWNHIAKTTDWTGAAYGLIPEDPYFPPYWTNFNGDKFYARCKDGYIDLLPFGGAGTYDIIGYMDCPLFFSNILG